MRKTFYSSAWYQSLSRRTVLAAALCAMFAISGVVFMSFSNAASFVVNGEAEAGAVGGNAAKVADATASRASVVRFGSAGPSPQPPTPPPPPGSGIWISPQEIMALPMTGTAWTTMKAVADSAIGTADISNQDNQHPARTLAVAYVAARTGQESYKDKARDHIMAAVETENDGRTLALGRALGAYVVAADVLQLKTYSPSDDTRFRTWLSGVRTETMPGHSRWVTLKQTHENAANNWGTFAGASRIAASLYLGDTADVARAANVFQAWLGDRSKYPSGLSWGNYFQPTSGWNATWMCGTSSTWTAINPDCGGLKSAAITEDITRSAGDYPFVDDTGRGYSIEAAQGVTTQAALLKRAGYDSWNWSDKAMQRMSLWMQKPEIGAWNYHSIGYHVAWVVNDAYGTNYPTKNMSGSHGRVMSWTDWTHAQ